MNKQAKAVSRSQQKLMGMAHAYNKGELPNASKEIKDLAKSMKKKDLKDLAKTKHKGLPEHKKKKTKKKDKSKKKKAELLSYFLKLADFLDQRNLPEAADLADDIANHISQDLIPGGKADNVPEFYFDPKELELGIPDETDEHAKNNPEIGKEIAKDHLMVDPHYYSKEQD